METIFLPLFDHIDSQFKPINHNNAVRDGRPELPQLVSVDSNDGRFTSSDAQICNFWDFYISEKPLEHCDDVDFSFPVFFNMKLHTAYVKRRPHLQTFLERVARMFDVVIFTASQSIYAEQLLDILDPDRKLFSRRMYRESCIFSDGNYTKGLTV